MHVAWPHLVGTRALAGVTCVSQHSEFSCCKWFRLQWTMPKRKVGPLCYAAMLSFLGSTHAPTSQCVLPECRSQSSRHCWCTNLMLPEHLHGWNSTLPSSEDMRQMRHTSPSSLCTLCASSSVGCGCCPCFSCCAPGAAAAAGSREAAGGSAYATATSAMFVSPLVAGERSGWVPQLLPELWRCMSPSRRTSKPRSRTLLN